MTDGWVVKEVTRTHHLIMMSEESVGTVAVVWNRDDARLIGKAPEMRELLADIRDELDDQAAVESAPKWLGALADRCRLLIAQSRDP